MEATKPYKFIGFGAPRDQVISAPKADPSGVEDLWFLAGLRMLWAGWGSLLAGVGPVLGRFGSVLRRLWPGVEDI